MMASMTFYHRLRYKWMRAASLKTSEASRGDESFTTGLQSWSWPLRLTNDVVVPGDAHEGISQNPKP